MIYKKQIICRRSFFILLALLPSFVFAAEHPRFWEVQAVDTMKYSRDIARENLNSKAFEAVIEKQVSDIASLGATHIAIATPYDKEFSPFLKRWADAARRHDLKIWFRGNWSGWEGWFEYPIISRAEHIKKTEKFILENKNLFEDGDIFTACPECENGGTGDPRFNGDVAGHRQFLTDEHKAMEGAFKKIGKGVVFNYNSMNGDVARLVMDKKTTEALGGVVAVDHYVRTSDKLLADINDFIKHSGGKIVLGEIGVPIPDIHGRMTDEAQAEWFKGVLDKLARNGDVVGINYWVSAGGSTSLWRENGSPKPITEIIRAYFKPQVAEGFVTDILDKPVSGAVVAGEYSSAISEGNGHFQLPYLPGDKKIEIKISAEGFVGEIKILNAERGFQTIILEKEKEGLWFRFLKYARNIAGRLLLLLK